MLSQKLTLDCRDSRYESEMVTMTSGLACSKALVIHDSAGEGGGECLEPRRLVYARNCVNSATKSYVTVVDTPHDSGLGLNHKS